MVISLKEFLQIFTEAAHPELQEIIRAPQGRVSKARLISKKMQDLVLRGEKTGVEDKMPKGSSRAYVQETDRTPVTIDGKPSKIDTGYKVAIPATLDAHHDVKKYGATLGGLQNEAENGDWSINNYRILRPVEGGRHHFETNHESGIFPPLLEHDHDHHSWSHIGHVDSIKRNEFRTLTASKEYPRGISHEQFTSSLLRKWNQNHGRHWSLSSEEEAHMDHIEQHPLVQKFLDHQMNYDSPPHDYGQLGNMGKWWHPEEQKYHIVARDHGFNSLVAEAYREARRKKATHNGIR